MGVFGVKPSIWEPFQIDGSMRLFAKKGVFFQQIVRWKALPQK